ncbi:hypothetical protein JL720_2545 [Aureococcus anophagefferens]|nr:hypothetical protein JL720_2545 [Aureococcus anophagefferens]
MDAKRAADARHCDRILAAPSFYDVLEVSRSADEAHVRKCYLKVSLRVHPDRNADPRAKAAFQRVAEAYETLAGPAGATTRRRRRASGRARAPGPRPRRGRGPAGTGAFDMDAAMRIFAAARRPRRPRPRSPRASPSTRRLATALLDVAPDAEGAALLTGFVGGAVAVANLLPASWRQRRGVRRAERGDDRRRRRGALRPHAPQRRGGDAAAARRRQATDGPPEVRAAQEARLAPVAAWLAAEVGADLPRAPAASAARRRREPPR